MNEDFRKSPPAPLAPAAFNLPRPFETTLPSGMKVVLFEDGRLPLVSFRMIFRSGDADEPRESVGLNSALASMLNEGTKNYTSRQLAEEIERLGANLSASSSSDTTVVAASSLSLYSSDILRLLAETILTPTFPEDELSLYKRNTIEGLKFQRSQANFLADEQVSKVIFGQHPYSIVSPSPADVENITREKLVVHHQRTFKPNNAVFVVVGDIRREEFLKEVEDRFGFWQPGETTTGELPEIPQRSERTGTLVDRKGSAQANIVLANPAIKRNHPDYFPVLVMNQILGAGASSRLFMNLREEKGYTYGAYSKFDMRTRAGLFEATAEVRTAVTGDSLKEFFYELNRIRDQEVPEEELQDAKNFLTGVFPIRAETQEGLTNLIVQQQVYDLPEDYLETYRDRVSEVTAAEVERVARKYITPESLAVVIVGDAEEILPQVRPYTENLEIFDTDGKPQDVSNYGRPAERPSVDVTGRWSLLIEAQGQQLPVTLVLEQTDGRISGSLESMLGSGEISSGKVSGNRISAVATSEMQGQTIELSIDAAVEDQGLTGQITTPVIPMPLPFSGKREG